MHFITWDPLGRAALFSGVFLLPLFAVLWVWYDTSGRVDRSRWYWRLLLTAIVLLAVPALVLGAANPDSSQADLLDTLGLLALGAGALALAGAIAYAVFGRGPAPYDAIPEGYEPYGAAQDASDEGSVVETSFAGDVVAPGDVGAAATTVLGSEAAGAAGGGSASAILLVKVGSERGRQFPVGALETIGRDAACSVCIADPRVSGRHAQIKNVNGQYTLLDLGSTNGSYLLVEGREERVREPQRLVDGDEIRLGRTVLQFVQMTGGVKR
jgi:hypothetical protein